MFKYISLIVPLRSVKVKIGAVVEWLEQLGYGVEGCGFESCVRSACEWKTFFVNQEVNGYLFRCREK